MIYLVNGKGAGPKACKNWFLLKHFKEKFSISNHRISVNLLLYDIAPCARIASEQFPLFILLLILYFMVHIRPQWANWQIQKCFIDLNFEISNSPSLKGKSWMETINGARSMIRNVDQHEAGFDPCRFINLKSENFECGICRHVVKEPKECEECGHLFCSGCLLNWLKINR